MARVTSKRQVTIPKAIADRYGIEPGDEVEFVPAPEGMRVHRRDAGAIAVDVEGRLELFDRATERQRHRQSGDSRGAGQERGWRRGLYERAGAR